MGQGPDLGGSRIAAWLSVAVLPGGGASVEIKIGVLFQRGKVLVHCIETDEVRHGTRYHIAKRVRVAEINPVALQPAASLTLVG